MKNDQSNTENLRANKGSKKETLEYGVQTYDEFAQGKLKAYQEMTRDHDVYNEIGFNSLIEIGYHVKMLGSFYDLFSKKSISESQIAKMEEKLIFQGDVRGLVDFKKALVDFEISADTYENPEFPKKILSDRLKESENQLIAAQENYFKRFLLADGKLLAQDFFSGVEQKRAIKKCSEFLVGHIIRGIDKFPTDRDSLIDLTYKIFLSPSITEKINMFYAELKIEAGQALEYTAQGAKDAANKGLELVSTSMKQIQDLYKLAKETNYKDLSKKTLQSLVDNLTKIGNIVKGMAIAVPLSVVAGLAVAAKTLADMSVKGYKVTEKGVKNLVNMVTKILKATSYGIGEIIKYTKLDVAYNKSVQTAKYTGEKLSQGAEYVEDKASKSAEYVGDKASKSAEYVGDKAHQGAEYVEDKARQGAEFTAQKAEAAYKKTSQTVGDVATSIGTILSASKDVLSEKAIQSLTRIRDTAVSLSEGGKSISMSALKGLQSGLTAVARYLTNADMKDRISDMSHVLDRLALQIEQQNRNYNILANQSYAGNKLAYNPYSGSTLMEEIIDPEEIENLNAVIDAKTSDSHGTRANVSPVRHNTGQGKPNGQGMNL